MATRHGRFLMPVTVADWIVFTSFIAVNTAIVVVAGWIVFWWGRDVR